MGMLVAGCIAVNSCSKSPTSASTSSGQSKRDLLTVWQAADTPIDQRLSVARSLLTTNMHTDEVEALLGTPTTRNRHNPGMPADAPPGTEHPRIHWWYDYQFKDGTVVVEFLQVMNLGRFEAELQSVGLGGKVQVIPLTHSSERTKK
jgi:hypothetical protein